jgi:hypothetical protein
MEWVQRRVIRVKDGGRYRRMWERRWRVKEESSNRVWGGRKGRHGSGMIKDRGGKGNASIGDSVEGSVDVIAETSGGIRNEWGSGRGRRVESDTVGAGAYPATGMDSIVVEGSCCGSMAE